jgi:hypothetical protein
MVGKEMPALDRVNDPCSPCPPPPPCTGIGQKQEVVERIKWRAALEFFNETGVMDLAYDGFFFQNDLATVAKLVAYADPDDITMDTECMPELEAYVAVAYKSANFAAAQGAGQTDSAAALQFAQRWLSMAAATAVHAGSHVTPYLYSVSARYDRGFQITSWPAAATAGLQASPSYYSDM